MRAHTHTHTGGMDVTTSREMTSQQKHISDELPRSYVFHLALTSGSQLTSVT